LGGDYSATAQIYEVGYLLGGLIVAAWGRDGLVRSIQANGGLPCVCGITTPEFEQRWASFVRGKYFGAEMKPTVIRRRCA